MAKLVQTIAADDADRHSEKKATICMNVVDASGALFILSQGEEIDSISFTFADAKWPICLMSCLMADGTAEGCGLRWASNVEGRRRGSYRME